MNQKPRVYISFANADLEIKDEFLRSVPDDPWEEFAVSYGEERMWRLKAEEQQNMLLNSDIIVLLVSRQYLKLPETSKEILPFILKEKPPRTRLLPIMIDENDWKLQVGTAFPILPVQQPLTKWADRKEAYRQVRSALNSMSEILYNKRAADILEKEKNARSGKLVMEDCSLAYVPVDLLAMDWLQSLSLSGNLISRIEFLDRLPALQHLNMEKNQVATMENLEQLVDLRELYLSNNELSELKNIDGLKKLERLELRHNHLPGIRQIGKNKALKILGVSNNQLSSLAGIAPLKKLEILYAAHNLLKEIDELEKLPKLKRIILTDNQIRSIKPLLGHIKEKGLKVEDRYSFNENETGIFIKDNTSLSEPSLEVIQSGREAVIKYFQDADRYGVQKLEVVKMILVGNSRVGKTNLSEYLRTGKISIKSNSTHVLDIKDWDAPFLKTEDGSLMLVKIFDFGGQDYYHDSHRMYYSHDTAYILLWENSTNIYSEKEDLDEASGEKILYENFPLEYWLESIKYNLEGKYLLTYQQATRRPGSSDSSNKSVPVFVIQNKIDIAEGRLDQKMLAERYPNIWGYFNMSLAANKRTAILQEMLSDYMTALDLSGRRLINFEIDIVSHYMQNKSALSIIKLDDFWKDCKAIINDDAIEFNKDNAIIMAQVLNNIGVILFEKIGEEDGYIYTNISSLNEIVKQVMQVARLGNDKGIFNKSQLSNIDDRDAILKLLLRNNSIIEINENEFLAPQFLPVTPDTSIHFFLHTFSYTQMRFVYKAYFHKTLLLNLFAKYLKGEHVDTSSGIKRFPFWRNGIIIKKGEAENMDMVLVEFEKDADMGIVNIRTMKPFNKTNLEREIENTLDLLNEGWTVEKQVAADSQHFFSVDFLHAESQSRQYSFTHHPDAFNISLELKAKQQKKSPTATVTPLPRKTFSINDFKHICDFDTLPKKLFISYSSRNSEFTRRFITHLEVLKTNGLIDPWYDRMIESGTRWDNTIRKEMQQSDLVIFLLSPDFLATEYIMKEEIPLAIELFGNSGRFFFVQLLQCNWEKTRLSEFQQTDDPGKPKNVITIGEPGADDRWMEVIKELEKKLEKILPVQ